MAGPHNAGWLDETKRAAVRGPWATSYMAAVYRLGRRPASSWAACWDRQVCHAPPPCSYTVRHARQRLGPSQQPSLKNESQGLLLPARTHPCGTRMRCSGEKEQKDRARLQRRKMSHGPWRGSELSCSLAHSPHSCRQPVAVASIDGLNKRGGQHCCSAQYTSATLTCAYLRLHAQRTHVLTSYTERERHRAGITQMAQQNWHTKTVERTPNQVAAPPPTRTP
jgi:hypothetical protein